MPHFHLSLQAGSDLILKRMKRRHLTADAQAVIARARAARPGIAIGADIIAGFPTETDALFDETLNFVRAEEIPFLHVFPYSERPGTPAARMPAVGVSLRKERAARLRAAGQLNMTAFHAAQTGQVIDLLTETATTGHSEHFVAVHLTAPTDAAQRLRARVIGALDKYILAEPV